MRWTAPRAELLKAMADRMIEFVQESSRMRAEGKSVIVLKQQQQGIDDSEAMEAFVRTADCPARIHELVYGWQAVVLRGALGKRGSSGGSCMRQQ
jgi:hypothetical protein